MKKILTLIYALIIVACPVFAKSQDYEYLNLKFWQKFNDQLLVDNLVKVYENNNDLKAAVLKVNEAQRIVKMSFANELPHIGFEGYVGQIFNSSDQIFGDVKIPDYTEAHFLLPLTMNYEIDIWGQNHLRTKAKKKQLEMVEQDEKAAYIYISSVFAVDYYNLIRTDKLIEYQNELIALQKQIIDAYKIKYQLGTATLSEIDAAEKNLTYMQEDLHKLSERQDVLKNQISTFLSDRKFDDISRNTFDNLNANILTPEGISFDILNQRPDRVKSELDLEKIGIDVKIAKRDFLPKFIISGNVGFNMYNISSPHKFLADIGVIPVWDIFMGGRKIQMLKMKKDTYNIAIQRYEKTILKSIQETNDALYSMKTADNIRNVVGNRLDTDLREMNYTVLREDAGTADSLDLLQQQERLIISQKEHVSSEINKLISAINLYQALGGFDFTDSQSL